MRNLIKTILIPLLSLFSASVFAETFAQELCNNSQYECIKVQKGESWETLFPNPEDRAFVMRINRMNTPIYRGMVIAIPTGSATRENYLSKSPFQRQISPPGEKEIIVSTDQLAWGAYDPNGTLVNWGPVSGGKGYCPDIGHGCHTVTGSFRVYTKQGSECVSTKFPIGEGGAPMPFCMFFHGGYALHGSPTVPGYNASHGCVRLFYDDAKWLNLDFIDLPNRSNHYKGTKVIVNPEF